MANEKIAASAERVLTGELSVPSQSGLCLKLVRLVVEDAFDWPSHKFYEYRSDIVERHAKDNREPWARDMERSLGNQGMTVLVPDWRERYVSPGEILEKGEPGDLLFRWNTARTRFGTYVGHVGVLMENGLVLENINPAYRSKSFMRGVTGLTPLEHFLVTRVVRFDPR